MNLIQNFFSFIWDGKPDKIKRNTLIGDIGQGGLKMLHLQSFMAYLKVSWVRRFLNNLEGSWQKLLCYTLKPCGGERSLYLQKEKLKEVSNAIQNPFWKDVFACLHYVKPYPKNVLEDILSCDILHFCNISESSYYATWKSKGVQFISDIINLENGEFLTFPQVRNKLNLEKFLKYYSIVANVPKDTKAFLKENCLIFDSNATSLNNSDKFIERLLSCKKPKFVYIDIRNRVVQLPSHKFFQWEEHFESETNDWSVFFNIAKKACKDPYSYNFQYKFLHRIIPTNDFLYKIKFKETKMCTFCIDSVETVSHLFYDCNITKEFWNLFQILFNELFVNTEFIKKNIFLGFTNEPLLVNLLVILAKKYIYKCKLNETKPSIIEFQCKIKCYKCCQHQIALNQGNILLFEKFWAPSLHLI